MKKKRFYFMHLLSFIMLGIAFNSCESESDNECSFSVKIKKDTIIYYEDALTIKNYPVIRGSQLPHFEVNANAGTNTIEASFQNSSPGQVKIGWLMYDPKEKDWESDLLTVGNTQSFYVYAGSKVKFYLFTVEGIGDTSSEAVNIKINNNFMISLVPSACRISPLPLSINLSGLGVPQTAGLNYTVKNSTDSWIGIAEEIHINDPSIRFIGRNNMGYSSRSGPLTDTIRFNFFGLNL